MSTATLDIALAAPKTRLEKTTVCLPLVHGSVAFYLGKKADEYQTHQWTLYLRGPNNEDLSVVISKVVFQLHASFAQPIREFTAPPYEVTEKGWGEFEAQIRIIWRDPNEKAVVMNHGIKLYPPGAPINITPTDTETPVVAETYDEVVFTDPTESFFHQLRALHDVPTIEAEYSQHEHFGQFSDNDDVKALLEAQKFLQQQLAVAKERLNNVTDDMEKVDQELASILQEQQTVPSTIPSKASQKSTKQKASVTQKDLLSTSKKSKK